MAIGDEFHKYEVVDRAHSCYTLLNELLRYHPMVECDDDLKAKMEAASDALFALYSAAGAKYL